MDYLSIIDKKRLGKELSKSEITFFFTGYMENKIEDYQVSSMLMAICINGMTFEETLALTDVMLSSGRKLDTSKISGIMVDKHSTGGVGDKTSLIIGPIMSALGCKMGKLSGRGLGITGGTIDKLESIPGFRVALSIEEFIDNVNKIGFAECEQTPEFTPLDKKLYELRSVSGTVSSIPLIASSIMSKKLAVGAEYILIDLKVGEGALIDNKNDAVELAGTMIEIGKSYNKTVIPILTNMSRPLGDSIGNALEVIEAMDILKGKTGILRDLCIELASNLYSRCKKINLDNAKKEVIRVLDSGKAYDKFIEFTKAQGGNIEAIETAPFMIPVKSDKDGTLKDISAAKIGTLATNLGGGRKKKGERINYGVGIVINKHIGDRINKQDILAYLYQNDETDHSAEALEAFSIVK
ncbi:MAG TPA: thymidine phosphorylase [Firmicutes bacterium]|nr:thymidine phosphorylase [Bacillota bacterium]